MITSVGVELESPLPKQKFAMSVDVEDYFQVWAFSNIISRKSWDGFELRVGEMTRRCLDLFDSQNTKATFFTLGWVAERDAALIREIVSRGHELASHGYDHTKVNQQTREEFHKDAARTKSLLEDISGAQVTGYRAAGFSIDQTTPWAYEVLAQIGYKYSSSMHPIAHDHYGDAAGEQSPYQPLKQAHFVEAPVATVDFLGRRLSCAGGGWFRASPFPVSDFLVKRAADTLDGPVIFYFHPWEIDPGQPRFDKASAKSKLRHYMNLDRMEGKLRKLLGRYEWGRVDNALASYQ
ncbi:MAG: polysaccharide deacetylase [Hyphococcus sp.]|nr:MAG: polysaccharide deacetylase [Marinicaulis sp.]